MRRGRPYRGENSGPGKDIVGKLDTQTPNWAGLVMSVVRRRPEVGGRRSNQILTHIGLQRRQAAGAESQFQPAKLVPVQRTMDSEQPDAKASAEFTRW